MSHISSLYIFAKETDAKETVRGFHCALFCSFDSHFLNSVYQISQLKEIPKDYGGIFLVVT